MLNNNNNNKYLLLILLFFYDFSFSTFSKVIWGIEKRTCPFSKNPGNF
jgi:hypothetical protein